LPFTFHPELMLIADPSITHYQELFFNAGRLDRMSGPQDLGLPGHGKATA
jgi:prolyl-tRNA editing enzyme YbaK/EbsC (Cys-tRNA(Pro) deacylase)